MAGALAGGACGIDSAAMTLFVERARGVASRFSVATADEAAAVVEICQRLDGIPLAIELAASRMASMTASEIRDRLDQRFRLLVGSRRGLERHHTLRHAVAWSYDLLDDAEKSLLERCSVFAGGFDLAAACAVGGCGDDLATLDALDGLVRKSLLVADRSSGRTRFSMLETIRQFGKNNLWPVVPPRRPGPRTRATLRNAKPTFWPCGTAPDNVRRTTGSPSSWPTCRRRSGGPPATTTSTWPPPSPPTRGFLAWQSQTMTGHLGRRAHQARRRRGPSQARVPVRDGRAVLYDVGAQLLHCGLGEPVEVGPPSLPLFGVRGQRQHVGRASQKSLE